MLLSLVSLVLYRNWRYEQELDSLLWKIDFREVQIHENEREQQSQKQTRVSPSACHLSAMVVTLSLMAGSTLSLKVICYRWLKISQFK